MATINRPQGVADEVYSRLCTLLPRLSEAVMDNNGDWTLKGFIDVWKKILPMTSDTKVISKAFELATTPIIVSVMEQENFQVELATKQNTYPDITISDPRTARKVALDLKSTYYSKGNPSKVNGFTLGAFTGYFRKRKEKKNIAYPYETYDTHLVWGSSTTETISTKFQRLTPLTSCTRSHRWQRISNFYFSRNGGSQWTAQDRATRRISAAS